ncbi:reverse transcriptase domain, reverse transcriptase zinc-binding domain protein [Tanacetum coccineum]
MDKNQNGKRKEKGTTLGDLAKRVKNIDGKIVGKDGKPLKMPFRNDVSNAADVEDVAADMREWGIFVNNHSHAHVLEVADVTKGGVDDTPSRKVSISPIVSIHEFEIEQDTLDETMMNTQHLGDGLVADKRTPTYAAITRAGTIKLKAFSNILSPNGAADVGGSEVTDMDANDTPNGSPTMALASCENLQNSERVNFRSLLNKENVDSYDCVLPQAVADVVKSRYENTLVGYFLGTSLAFPIVQKYVNNAWSNFGLQNLMKTDDGVFMFKFASKEALEKWSTLEPLAHRVSSRDIVRSGLTLQSKVSDIVVNGTWLWPVDMLSKYPFLSNYNTPINDDVDRLVWSDSMSSPRTTRCVIEKLVVAASAYYVWQERNWRLFQKGKRSIDQVVECIKSVVRLKLLSCKLKKSKSGESMAKLWDLPEAVFV